MLHKGILPHHTKWVKLLENLRYVVVDELHSLRGVYGSHVANILRRLRRLCEFYGSRPQFICSSATIGNPKELAEALTEREMTLVDRSGAPRGERYFAIYNPPVVNRQLGIRKSALNSARDVSLSFLTKGLQTIVFAPSRLATEVLVTYLKEALETKPGSEGVIRGYRGGYLPLKRREIERGLREGSVLGVVSTNALELGIDIGSLDAAVLVGYPGSVASAWQQAGRAGRRVGHVGGGARRELDPPQPVHRQEPRLLLRRARRAGPHQPRQPPDPRQPRQVRGLRAALRGRRALREGEPRRDPEVPRGGEAAAPGGGPLALDERQLPGRRGQPALGLLRQLRDPGRDAASRGSSPRWTTTRPRRWSTRRRSTSSRAGPTSWRSTTTRSGASHVREAEVDYYTDAITYTKVRILERFAEEPRRNGRRNHGEVHVTSQVVGFKKIKFHTNENVGSGELTMPENEMHTTAYWLTVPREIMRALPYGLEERRDGVVALSYTLGQLAALFLMCDRHDLGVALGDNGQGEARIERGLLRLGAARAGRRERAAPRRGLRAEHLRLRRLPGRHRALRAALPAPRPAARREPGAHRRLPVRPTAARPAWGRPARWAAGARKWPWRSWTRCCTRNPSRADSEDLSVRKAPMKAALCARGAPLTEASRYEPRPFQLPRDGGFAPEPPGRLRDPARPPPRLRRPAERARPRAARAGAARRGGRAGRRVLPLKARLERLVAAASLKERERRRAPAPVPLEELVEGMRVENERGEFFLVETAVHLEVRHGDVPLSRFHAIAPDDRGRPHRGAGASRASTCGAPSSSTPRRRASPGGRAPRPS